MSHHIFRDAGIKFINKHMHDTIYLLNTICIQETIKSTVKYIGASMEREFTCAS
jgi:hypothetical protein